MKNVLQTGVLVMAMAFAGNAMATWGDDNSCRGNQNCNTTNTTDNSTHNQGGQGGNGTGIGVGVGKGGDASAAAGAHAGAAAGAVSGSGVFGSGNSHNANKNANVNTAFGGKGGQGGTAFGGVGVGGKGGDATQGQQQGQSQIGINGQQQGIDRSGNSASFSDGGNATQGQVGINKSQNSNVNEGNTLIVGGGGQEGPGGAGTLNSSATNGDVTGTQTTDVSGNNSSVGDVNVTVEGMSDEAARALGQPDQTNVDARDLSSENQSIDASTEINDNSVYEAPKMSAASAAPVFSSVCTSGASGQGRGLGISLSVTSPVCEHLMMADAFNAVGEQELVMKHLKRAASHANWKGTMAKFRHVITLGVL